MPSRYDNLKAALEEIRRRGTRHLRLLEVGTYDGVRGASLLRHWMGHDDKFTAEYHGFDLFEGLTEEMSKAELSKSKLPPSAIEVLNRLTQVPRAAVKLYKGNTRTTLPEQAENLPEMSLIFVDGGHSLETIESDWNSIRGLIGPETIVLFDDYYENRSDFGCKPLIQGLRGYTVELLDPVDHIPQNDLRIRMARVMQQKQA